MKIRLGYDIAFETPQEVAVVAMLHVHPTRVPDLLEPDVLETNAGVTQEEYVDSFGNLCTRLAAPAGELQLRGSTLIEDSGKPDALGVGAVEHAVAELATRECGSFRAEAFFLYLSKSGRYVKLAEFPLS